MDNLDRDLLTTREVAKMLGVGTTSIKRWADSRVLQCVKTPGGHRRFPRNVVESFLRSNLRHQPGDDPLQAETAVGRGEIWLSRLRNGMSVGEIRRMLQFEVRAQGSWFDVADSLTIVLEEIGKAWARGDISVIQEHIVSERLSRGIANICETIATPEDAHSCMLMAAEGEDHTIGLNLVELCLREAGWRGTWVGAKTPIHIACEFISSSDVAMVAVSASEYSRDRAALADQVARLGAACGKRNIPLVLGGHGLWPEEPGYGHRVYTFAQFHKLLDQLTTNVN